jgi:hypothetical protein
MWGVKNLPIGGWIGILYWGWEGKRRLDLYLLLFMGWDREFKRMKPFWVGGYGKKNTG